MKLNNKKIIISTILALIYLSNNYPMKRILTTADFESEIFSIPSRISSRSTYALHKHRSRNKELQIMVIYFNLESLNHPSIIHPIFFFHVKKDKSIERLDLQMENSFYQIQIKETKSTEETYFEVFEIKKGESPRKLTTGVSPVFQEIIKMASELWASEEARTYSSLNKLITKLNMTILPWLPYTFL